MPFASRPPQSLPRATSLPSLPSRIQRHSKFYGGIASLVLLSISLSFFFLFPYFLERRQVRSETLQHCGRLISWLNIIAKSLFFYHSDWSTRFYFTIHRSWPLLVLQRQLGVPRTIEIPFSTVTDRSLFLGTRFLGWRVCDVLVLKV